MSYDHDYVCMIKQPVLCELCNKSYAIGVTRPPPTVPKTSRCTQGGPGIKAVKYKSQSYYAKAIEYHLQDLAISKGLATGRAKVGRTGTLGARISRLGTMRRPSSTTRRTWRLQSRWATGLGRAGRTRTSGARISRRGTSARP